MTTSTQRIIPPAAGPTLQVPRAALTPQQQLEALRRVQAQAEQRVQLGKQLFLAAESQTTRYQRLVEQLNTDRQTLREQMQDEMQASLLAANQKFDAAEDRVAQMVDRLEQRIDQLETQWAGTATRLQAMLDESQRMMDDARRMIGDAGETGDVGEEQPDTPPSAPSAPPAGPALSYRELMAKMYERKAPAPADRSVQEG